MRIAIGGSSGLTGRALTTFLRSQGHEVIRLVRSSSTVAKGDVPWDPAAGTLDASLLDGVEAVINMSGENLGQRWTEDRKRSFRTSRIDSTTLLARSIASMKRKPSVFISSSAIGVYGSDRGDAVLDENASEGDDFLAMLCRDWEACAAHAAEAGIRVVMTRTSPILSPDGGMLEKLLLPFRLGAGGKMGSGDQWVSWIGMADFISAIQFLIGSSSLNGPVNVTAPNPVRNEELAKELGRVLHRPSIAPVPAAALRLMLGREMADMTVLSSLRVTPRKLLEAGFSFRFPLLGDSLRHELGLPAR